MRRVVVMLALAVGGCASTNSWNWTRLDGAGVDDRQLAADKVICRGQMQAAGLGGGNREDGIVFGPKGPVSVRGQAMADVFEGCMAQRGYAALKPGG